MARTLYDVALRKFKAAVKDQRLPALSDVALHLRSAAGHLIAAVDVLGREVLHRRGLAFFQPNDDPASRSRRPPRRKKTVSRAEKAGRSRRG